ncbi:hypothetical protein QFZ94_002177 [Paraburkholderia sp. JPY465]
MRPTQGLANPARDMVFTPKATNSVAEAGGSISELTMRLTRSRFTTLDRFPLIRSTQIHRGSSPGSAAAAYCNVAVRELETAQHYLVEFRSQRRA